MFRKETNRGRTDIISEIVRACAEDIRKTPIMYRANLSYQQLEHYLKELQEKGFIEQGIVGSTNFYRATARGREFLSAYDKMMQILDLGSIDQYIHARRIQSSQS